MESRHSGIALCEPLGSAKGRTSLHKLFTRVGEASPLSHHALDVLRLTNNENTPFDDLQRVIQQDPAFAAKILRCVNSIFYGLRHEVSSLHAAIGLLGFRELRNIAATVFLSRLFRQPSDFRNYSREGLWKHLVAVATTSRLVSLVCGRAAPDEAFMAGLLHDLGLVLIDLNLRTHFCRVLQRLDRHKETVDIERKILTFDHTEIGEFVAGHWNFSEAVTASIRHHHQPQQYAGPARDVIYVVAISNYLCSRYGYTSLGVRNLVPPPDDVYAGLGLDETDLRIIWDELELTLQKAAAIARI